MARLASLAIAAACICLFGCEPPNGPKRLGVCLHSESQESEAEEIRAAAIATLEDVDLWVLDRSEIARRVENNEHVVLIDARDNRYLHNFQILLKINPSYGGSDVTLYKAADGVPPPEMDRLLDMLVQDFEFTISAENEHGGCAPGDIVDSPEFEAKESRG
ncbi:MAG: hypothetical protein QNI99_10820 [Woeseiaceae bacterium]|nr:hypothetical protein [Woeseiaceae bacterium]